MAPKHTIGIATQAQFYTSLAQWYNINHSFAVPLSDNYVSISNIPGLGSLLHEPPSQGDQVIVPRQLAVGFGIVGTLFRQDLTL